MFRRAADPVPGGRRDRVQRVLYRFALFDLDEGDEIALGNDQIDFSERRFVSPCQNPVAFQDQADSREAFRDDPGFSGAFAFFRADFHDRFRDRASS